MLFATFLLTGLASAVLAITPRQVTTEFAPWNITNVSGGSPSGRPGSSPNETLSISIREPNVIRLQRVPRGYAAFLPWETTCSWAWDRAGTANFPIGIETLCSPVDDTLGNFTMTLSQGESSSDFTVKIKETKEVTVFGTRYVRVFEAEKALKDELFKTCGGSGVCGIQLADGPVEVQQELTTSIGTCEEASIGGC
ncbi:uncharacterized protein EKO05_0006504 [Ascochyta rabiei]|uniref:Uncharacterized protein n=1 Tax=Didymella rabiei TaxID=5454 RepID=A0A162W7V2_DIDRA|nr:uncharacterized protein EKO05_0006504 [Ascochyta rabiei]KZM18855.1 hypothetical protein ST47_g10134 [Ascochyta rabiei]UPX16080.1 hypothetical protein EKO05_0006504 [Ascochyta rabiei]